jgi:sulfite exporter TauE/SafE
MDFSLAFILGLLGSLHCAAMCGPLMLALPVPPGGPARFAAGRCVYQFGRIATYCLLGVMAGLIGKSIFHAGFQRWLSITLGLTILAGFLISKKIALSAPVIHLVTKLKNAMFAQLQRRSFRSLALLGMLNGLLPCGLVYVAAAGAVSRGTLSDAIFYMAVFGLGTLPMMLAVSLSRKLFPPTLRLKLNRAIPLGICLLAFLLILRGMALGIPYVSPDLSFDAPNCCGH